MEEYIFQILRHLFCLDQVQNGRASMDDQDNPFDCFRTSALPSVHVTFEGSTPWEICFRGGGKYAIDENSCAASTNDKCVKNKTDIVNNRNGILKEDGIIIN